MIKKLLSFDKIIKYIYVFFGAVFLSIGVAVILAPNNIASGGAPGIAIVLNHYLDTQLGLLIFLINAPLILIGMKYVNKGFAYRTIFSIFVISCTVDFIYQFLNLEGLVLNNILAAIFGGVFVGIGLGLIIMGNAAAGGPAVLAKLLSGKTKFKEENIIIFFDSIIVVSAGIVFENIESTFLSLISVYVSSKLIDTVLSGRPTFKMVHIATKESELISKKISKKLEIKGSVVNGLELDFSENKKVILLVIESTRIIELKTLVQKYDEESFIVISDASEIMGRGY